MLIASFFLKNFWIEIFPDLYLIGKVMLFPLFFAFSAVFIVIGIIEFFIIDLWIMLFAALSKSYSIKSAVHSLLY